MFGALKPFGLGSSAIDNRLPPGRLLHDEFLGFHFWCFRHLVFLSSYDTCFDLVIGEVLRTVRNARGMDGLETHLLLPASRNFSQNFFLPELLAH